MSMIAYNQILKSLRDKFGTTMPAAQMEETLNIIGDILSEYEIQPCAHEDVGEDCLVEAYLDALRVEGRSEKTIERYRYMIGRLLKATMTTSRNITTYHIRKYLSDEKARGIADSTLKGTREVYSAYFGWLFRDGLIQKNVMGNIGPVKCQQRVKEIFSETDIEKLKNGCRTLRDKAIICFLKSTGCRISEVTQLNRSDVDLVNLECVVLGKGNKQRTVYMDPVTGMVLLDYLQQRTDDDPALFLGARHERLKPNGIRIMLKKLGKATGVEHVHPHKFRRTEITELVNRGMPIEQVKTIAGHENIDTTMGYVKIDHIGVKNAYRKYA